MRFGFGRNPFEKNRSSHAEKDIRELAALNRMTQETLRENERLTGIAQQEGPAGLAARASLAQNAEALKNQEELRAVLARKLGLSIEDAAKIFSLQGA